MIATNALAGQSLALRLATWLERLCGLLVGVLLAGLLGVVLAAVAARYLFGSSIVGAEELALWLHVALVFAGLPLVSNGALAMRLDILAGRLGRRGQLACEIFGDAVVVHACLVFLFGARTVIEEIGGVSTVLGAPEGWRFVPVLFGAGAAVLLGWLRAWGHGRAIAGTLALLLGIGLYLVASFSAFEPLARPSVLAGGFALFALLIGAPLPHSLIAAASLAIPFGALLPEAAIVQNSVAGIGRFLLLAIPFFLLAGALMTAGGLAERLVALAATLVGHRRGGMAQTTLVTNLMISGMSGSSIADAAFGAKVLAPALVQSGYRPERAAAIVAATSILPNIVPPSIAFLILAAATDLSVGSLFAGGLAAGFLICLALALALYLLSGSVPGGAKAGQGARRKALLRAMPVIGLALVILFGIRFGVVTTTEAAGLAALYALLVALFIRRGAGAGTLAATFAEAGREAAAVGLLIGTAAPFVFMLAVDGLPRLVVDLFAGVSEPLAVLLLANLVLLVADERASMEQAIAAGAEIVQPADRQEWVESARTVWDAFADQLGGMQRIKAIRAEAAP
ncbi:TRAP transporter large permease subunit [Aurantimonas sp. A3-2-R12]|uniref:TRAP transporter large permease subunit n=1 Tax=Aurantimonas sp. A3-2-R12 TaxID=3114362 RepID=UPI002E176F41|nr:TRAP transporter large permease subunit [Aurantimonas sp. A3-2-R12]